MKLRTSTLKMARPSPQAAENSAPTTISADAVALMPAPLVDRDRRRHRDTALSGERITVGPEPDVQPYGPEPQAAAPAELHLLALVARHTAAQRERTHALLRADVDHGSPPRVYDIAPDRRPGAHPQRGVGDVGDGELRRALDVVLE